MKIKGHLWLIRIMIILGFLAVAGIMSYFWLRIYPMLNPRFKTPADFADSYWDIKILCTWRMRIKDGAESIKVRKIDITAYTDRVQETDSNPQETASGRQPYVGSCAVSRDLWGWLIKEGYKIYIPALNKREVIVEDKLADKDKRGKLIRRRIDIFYHREDLDVARKILIKNTVIYISKIEREKKK